MYSTIQDSGRLGYREYGLPVAGAIDQKSFRLANWLVRNDWDEGVIETVFHGIEIEFLSATTFAVTGGNMTPLLNNKPISNWKSYRAKAGMRLRLSNMVSGLRSYISFAGGFKIDPVLGSLSTYVPAVLGGYRGRELRPGDTIPLYPGLPKLTGERIVPDDLISLPGSSIELRVVRGVDFDLFDPENTNKFFGEEYAVSSRIDRMGLRLEGQSINTKMREQIISYGIQKGTVQISGDGYPIIMGSDCQTIGGYPQLVSIISADLDMIGQLKQGDKIKFKLIERTEAIEILKSYRDNINALFGTSKASVCIDCVQKRN